MNTQTQPTRVPVPDVPLPGMYHVLTAQVNVTLHPSTGVVKYVMTLRDPSPTRQVELSRSGGTRTWTDLGAVRDEVAEMFNGMLYLGGMPGVGAS